MIAVLDFSPLKSQDINWTKKQLTEKEIPVAPDKMPDYLWQQFKKDPFTKEHFGWKLAFIQHPMYLVIDEDRGEPISGERTPRWGACSQCRRLRRKSQKKPEFTGRTARSEAEL